MERGQGGEEEKLLTQNIYFSSYHLRPAHNLHRISTQRTT
jgi:hypothetical protein